MRNDQDQTEAGTDTVTETGTPFIPGPSIKPRNWLWRLHRQADNPERPYDQLCVRYSASWIVTPLWLGLLRLVFALYAFATLFAIIGIEVENDVAIAAGLQFAYFTSLGYWALAFYFLFSVIHSITCYINCMSLISVPRIRPRPPLPQLAMWSYGFIYAHAALHATIATFPFIVTIVFWTVLRNNAFFNSFAVWNNVSQHALNTVFVLVDLVVSMAPPPEWNMLLVIVGVLALYLAETYVYFAAKGDYVYPFLNPANGSGLVAGAIVGILAGSVLVFVVVRYLIILRIRLTEPKGRYTSTEEDGGPGAIELAQPNLEHEK